MNIALIQMTVSAGDKQANYDTASWWIEQAVSCEQ